MNQFQDYININSRLAKQTLDLYVHYEQSENMLAYQVEVLQQIYTFNKKNQLNILYFKDQSQSCRILVPDIECITIQNCKLCTPIQKCTDCNPNYALNSNTDCSTCGSGKFFNSTSKPCGDCSANCKTCSSATSCSECDSNYQLNSSKNCQACQLTNGQYYDSQQKICGNCPSNCQQCNSSSNCSLCSSGYQVNSSKNGCQACLTNQGQYYDSSNNTCGQCSSQCLTCKDSPKNCTACQTYYQLIASDNTCQACQINQGQYYDFSTKTCMTCFQNCLQCTSSTNCQLCKPGYSPNSNQCSPCNNSCLTCNGPNSNNCLSCNSGLYLYTSNSTCQQTCNTGGGYFANQNTCSPCDQTCSTCNGSYSTQCITCTTGLYKFGGDNLCKACPTTSTQTNISNCQNSQQQCLYNNQTKSYELTGVCSICKQGYTLSSNSCVDNCSLTTQNYYYDIDTSQCQCSPSYPYKHIRNDNSIFCNPQYNVITVVFNRVPYPNEVSVISIQLDPGKLILNTDYQIISQQLVSNTVVFDISVEQNRRVNQIEVSYNNQQTIFQLQNAVLTTSNYNNSQQSVQGKIDNATSASKALISGQGNGYSIILILKQFQILCFLSNFIQFFGPLILFKNYLPQMVYVGTILASSFIFSSIPDASQLDASSQNDNTSQSSASSEQQLLQDLGLQGNLYYALPIPNISLIISVILVLLCCFARWVMEGKQYTMEISIVGIKLVINNYLIPEDYYIQYQQILDLIKKSNQILLTQNEIFQNKNEKLFQDIQKYIDCIYKKKNCEFFDILNNLQSNSQITKFVIGEDYILNNLEDKNSYQKSIVYQVFTKQKIFKEYSGIQYCRREFFPGYYSQQVFINYFCKKCDQSCTECDGEGLRKCISCDQNSHLYQNQCISCKINNGEFYNLKTKKCEQCLQNCQVCNQSNNCTQCIANYEFNNQLNKCVEKCKNCAQCLQNQYLDDQSQSCQDCDKSCKTCKFSSKNCTSCQDLQFLNTQNSTCIDSCDQPGFYVLQKKLLALLFIMINMLWIFQKLHFVTCSGPSQYTTCATNLYQYGEENLCKPCHETSIDPAICQCSSLNPYQHNQSDNTIFCSKQQQPGYYCDSNKICKQCLQPNCEVCTNQQMCKFCLQGYYLWHNNCLESCESNQGLEFSQSNKECVCIQVYIFYASSQICVLQLQISSIKLTKDSKYNIITVIFDRPPYPDELKTINLQIDPSKLTQNRDYTIISYAINNVKSLGQSLSTQEGLLQTVINILKNFQILCLLSNFVQLLGPLIVFKAYLPQPLYTGALLGASFKFTEIPNPDELSVNTNTNSNEEIDNHYSLSCIVNYINNYFFMVFICKINHERKTIYYYSCELLGKYYVISAPRIFYLHIILYILPVRIFISKIVCYNSISNSYIKMEIAITAKKRVDQYPKDFSLDEEKLYCQHCYKYVDKTKSSTFTRQYFRKNNKKDHPDKGLDMILDHLNSQKSFQLEQSNISYINNNSFKKQKNKSISQNSISNV
ncbi:hypothetical protein ABPG72_009214 [Tetrahymena utriculariae]